MTETAWFWIGMAGMTLGAAGLAVVGKTRTQDEEGDKTVHVLVPIVAAVSYLAMAFGQGGVHLGGRIFWYARYIDWSITTPLLLLGLCMTALHGAHRRRGLVAAVLGADALMIVTGLFSGLSDNSHHRWTWFLVSCGAFVMVYVSLFGPLRREASARDHERRTAYTRHAVILSVLWLVYPIVVLLGPDGTGVWSAATATGCITILDLLAKVGYGFLTSSGSKRIADADLARDEVSPVAISTHAVPSDAGVGVPTP